MTDTEKAKIKELRQQGLGYKKISQKTGLSVNTVKSFCQRNGLRKLEKPNSPKCRYCGKDLSTVKGRSDRKFCSAVCRFSWWNKHRMEQNSSNRVQITCPVCGKIFQDYPNRNRKYCSCQCYQAARFGVTIDG